VPRSAGVVIAPGLHSQSLQNKNFATVGRRLSGNWQLSMSDPPHGDFHESAKARHTRAILVKSGNLAACPKCLAGAGGIEPPHGGIKIPCLTAWLRPNGQSADVRQSPGALRLRRSIERPARFQPPGSHVPRLPGAFPVTLLAVGAGQNAPFGVLRAVSNRGKTAES
jgi:hypothetical protein